MSKKLIYYPEFVNSLVKPDSEIATGLKKNDLHMMHMALGLAGEAGELIDAIKKAVIYGKTPDIPNMIEELGDIYFYMTGIMNSLDIDFNDIVQANVAKLKKRYPNATYTDKAAQERADKQESGETK